MGRLITRAGTDLYRSGFGDVVLPVPANPAEITILLEEWNRADRRLRHGEASFVSEPPCGSLVWNVWQIITIFVFPFFSSGLLELCAAVWSSCATLKAAAATTERANLLVRRRHLWQLLNASIGGAAASPAAPPRLVLLDFHGSETECSREATLAGEAEYIRQKIGVSLADIAVARSVRRRK